MMSKRIVDEDNFKVDSNKEELLALLDQIASWVLVDPSGAPEEIYNCRCTLVAALDDVEYDSDRFTRLPAAVSYNDLKEHKYEKRNK